mgnify:FL=1
MQLLQSYVDYIQGHLVGVLVFGVQHTQLDLSTLKSTLLQHIAAIEELGYARPTY